MTVYNQQTDVQRNEAHVDRKPCSSWATSCPLAIVYSMPVSRVILRRSCINVMTFLYCKCRVDSCCEGTVRLEDGTGPYKGRVEVCIAGTWKTICDKYWDTSNAIVTCTQLGYPSEGT